MWLMHRNLRSVREIQERAHKLGYEVDTAPFAFQGFPAFEGDDVEGMAIRSEIEIEKDPSVSPRRDCRASTEGTKRSKRGG
jgi:hypothetical protein